MGAAETDNGLGNFQRVKSVSDTKSRLVGEAFDAEEGNPYLPGGSRVDAIANDESLLADWPGALVEYFTGRLPASAAPPRVGMGEVMWSGVGSFLGIALLGLLHFGWLAERDMVLIIGSFGASAVLIHAALASPLAQPRNLLGGHVFSAVVGVTVFQLAGGVPWLAAALAVSLAIVVMQLTRTLHPPGGATALIAVIGSGQIHDLGYLYALVPVASGAVIMLIVAVVVNNLSRTRRYPLYWW